MTHSHGRRTRAHLLEPAESFFEHRLRWSNIGEPPSPATPLVSGHIGGFRVVCTFHLNPLCKHSTKLEFLCWKSSIAEAVLLPVETSAGRCAKARARGEPAKPHPHLHKALVKELSGL